MSEPRPEKVAVVTEVRERLGVADAAILTEYRGLTVAQMAELRRTLAGAGGEYKVFKNTLVKLAIQGSPHEGLTPMLVGPTAIAFVSGDVSAVAKALRDFSRSSPALVLKGGIVDGSVLSAADLTALADLPSREVLLAQVAGTMAAPLRQMAGLLAALPRNLAYGLQALIDRGGAGEAAGIAAGSDASAAETVAATDATASEAASDQAASDQAASDEAASDEAASDEAASDEAASDEAASDEAASDEAASDQATD